MSNGYGIVAGLSLALPQQLQLAVEDPEMRVAVLDQDLAPVLVARRSSRKRSSRRSPSRRAALCPPPAPAASRPTAAPCPCGRPGPGAGNPSPSRLRSCRRRRCRGSGTACRWSSRPLRGSGRPSCQRTLPSRVTAVRQLIWSKASPLHARDVLRDQHVRYAVAVQVAEADVAAGAEARRVELLPELRLRDSPSRSRASSASRARDARGDRAAPRRVGRRRGKSWNRAGLLAVTPALPLQDLAVGGLEHQLAVHVGADPRPVVLHLQTRNSAWCRRGTPRRPVPSIRGTRQLPRAAGAAPAATCCRPSDANR